MIIEALSLKEIAYARSGDKGANANIGVIAYTQKGYEFICEQLTAKYVGEYFSALEPTKVLRYELPNLLAVNFVLFDVLAGGASLSLRIDSQGKALGQAILEMPIQIPEDLVCAARA